VDEIGDFGAILLAVAAGLLAAVVVSKLGERFPVPAPLLFLLAAASVSDLFPDAEDALSVREVERIGVVALVVILFDGGMHVGWRRLRSSIVPIALLGTAGTFATAAITAAGAHYLLGFEWMTAWLLGAAVAPTDPAVMFSVLGNREVGGRSGTILEGESGANDPVGIALMIGLLELATHDDANAWTVVVEFAVEMAVGLSVGLVGAAGLLRLMQRFSLPNEGLYPIRVLAAAGVIYGVASVLGGSGFLAVFIAGIVVGDARAPYKGEIERFHSALASLAEIAVFAALGLTIDLTEVLSGTDLLDGLVIAAVLFFVARPVAVFALLLPARLRFGEKVLIAWGGLKGAVPILLAAFVLLAGVEDDESVYDIVFVVVALSVLVQGSSMAWVARRTGIPMRTIEPEPWDVSIRLRNEPRDLRRYVVSDDARAVGRPIRDLPLGEHAWISLVVRDGQARQARGSHVIEPGDELLVLADARSFPGLRRLFEGA
jgi:cell volume regulation protein A